MGTLVCNGTTLLRRANSLVRTPIYKTLVLEPDDRAYYAIAGDYYNGWPNGGFKSPGYTEGANVWCADQLNNAFFNGYGNQIWRRVEGIGALNPRNIYYSGRYSTHNPTPDYSEAYEQIAAYHFTLPQQYRNSRILGLRWMVEHTGEIICYMSAYAKSPNNFFTQDWAAHNFQEVKDQDWDNPTQEQRVGLFQSLNNNIYQMHNQCQDTVVVQSGLKNGSPTGWEMIWTDRTTDGCIPLCSTPYYKTYELNGAMTSAFDINKGGWLISIPYHEAGDVKRPSFVSKHMFYWLCSSFRTYTLGVDLLVVE